MPAIEAVEGIVKALSTMYSHEINRQKIFRINANTFTSIMSFHAKMGRTPTSIPYNPHTIFTH